MTCSEFQHRLSGYMDGELSRWTRWKVGNHLRCCQDCSTLLRELSAVDSGLLALAREEAPDYVTSAVMRRLPAMPPAARSRPLRLAWMAGAVGALTLAGMQLLALAGAYSLGFQKGTATQQVGGRASVAGSSGPILPRGSAARPVSTETPGEPAAATAVPDFNAGRLWSQPRRYPAPDPAEIQRPPVKERSPLRRKTTFSPAPQMQLQGQ
jgi:anti-sigma factor RsiW